MLWQLRKMSVSRAEGGDGDMRVRQGPTRLTVRREKCTYQSPQTRSCFPHSASQCVMMEPFFTPHYHLIPSPHTAFSRHLLTVIIACLSPTCSLVETTKLCVIGSRCSFIRNGRILMTNLDCRINLTNCLIASLADCIFTVCISNSEYREWEVENQYLFSMWAQSVFQMFLGTNKYQLFHPYPQYSKWCIN